MFQPRVMWNYWQILKWRDILQHNNKPVLQGEMCNIIDPLVLEFKKHDVNKIVLFFKLSNISGC